MYKTITGKQALIILGNGGDVEFYEDGRWFSLNNFVENFSLLDLLGDDFQFHTKIENLVYLEDGWISVGECVPPPKIEVVISTEWKSVTTDVYFDKGYAEGFSNYDGAVTHWKPLPKPPKE